MKRYSFPIPFFALIFALGVLTWAFGVAKYPQCANSISCIEDLTGGYLLDKKAIFMGKEIDPPNYVAENPAVPEILGEATQSKKHIYVDLTNQRLYAYQGDALIYNFPISSGKWGQTPTGDFKFWIKLRHTLMTGGSKTLGTYYYLPNVPYTMYFYNDSIPKTRGFGIHGAYWHNNFGHPMSHGCINLHPSDAEKLYHWAEPPPNKNVTYVTDEAPGTPITIFGETPKE